MISIRNLHKSFGQNKVLCDVNLDFSPGKVCGIVGENGAGKTTLFRCIAGLEAFEGQVISSLSPLKNHLGLLVTDPFIFNKITGEEYIRMLCQARGITPHDLRVKNIFELPLNEYASTYSTGMKKKLALTALLMQQNECFILDEPYNGVDIQSNIILTELILKLKSRNKVVIISSHIFSTLQDTCDEIHVLKKGSPIRTILKPDFKSLEDEMKAVHMGDKLDRLGI